MFDKNIYASWELHQDATQLEINYNFFAKLIEILNIDSLLKYNNQEQIKITDPVIIRQWQIKKLVEINKDFAIISNHNFSYEHVLDDDIIVQSIFKIVEIFNELKLINYKSQQIEVYDEPAMFILACRYLPFELLEDWMYNLTSKITNSDNKNNFEKEHIVINWKIISNLPKLRNILWYLENLSLSFKDISSWYSNYLSEINNDSSLNSRKPILTNIMNHWIIYSLTDFYLKYNYDLNDKELVSYQKLSEIMTIEIKQMIEEKTFAIVAFKSIAYFIGELVKKQVLQPEDHIIINFQNILKLTCSNKNYNKLIEMMVPTVQADDLIANTSDKETALEEKKEIFMSEGLFMKNKGE